MSVVVVSTILEVVSLGLSHSNAVTAVAAQTPKNDLKDRSHTQPTRIADLLTGAPTRTSFSLGEKEPDGSLSADTAPENVRENAKSSIQ